MQAKIKSLRFNSLIFMGLYCILFFLSPAVYALDAASGALNFKPPPGDISVLFLSNIFGVVDGVLAGNGSQITGEIFGVFNTAVLAIGSILVTYTLFVSTLNTAQDGQYIGKRWASMFVPMRSISGVALILPKASGYCVMQVFMMWVVVQGIGAADKVWAEALAYLNQGGSIVRPNVDPITNMKNSNNTEIYNGAYGMLVGEVCMKALELGLNNYQAKVKSSNYCDPDILKPGGISQAFCTMPIPSFIDSVDFISPNVLAMNTPGGPYPDLGMPNFDAKSPYAPFNGVCGAVTFANFSQTATNLSGMGLSNSEQDSMDSSRAVALNQMYLYLAPVAEKIAENAPFANLAINCASNDVNCYDNETSLFPLGVPLRINMDYCKANLDPYKSGGEYVDDACLAWDLHQGATTIVLLRGTEIQDAVATYNGMMAASLYIDSQATNADNYKEQRAFLAQARQSGWLLAGAYYFRLAILTSQVLSTSGDIGNDTESKLAICPPKNVNSGTACGAGNWSITDFVDYFTTLQQTINCPSMGSDNEFLALFCDNGNLATSNSNISYVGTIVKGINKLISGETSTAPVQTKIPNFKVGTIGQPVYGTNATSAPHNNSSYSYPNSIYGFLINSSALVMPGQPGSTQPNFVLKLTFNSSTNVPKLGNMSISGGKWNIPGQVIAFVYNYIVKTVFNILISILLPIFNMIIFAMLLPPLTLLSSVFLGALEVLKDPNVNPILGLANMGVALIEGSFNSFIIMVGVTAPAAALGQGVLTLIMILLPVVMMWLGIMTTVGIMATYYIPLVPFTIFLFSSIGWLIGVVEAMVAAPLMALGIMHPDSDHIMGRGDEAITLMMGIFLRPAMMILGYIFGIILSYVGIWFINAGFIMIIPEVTNMKMIDLETGSAIKDSRGNASASSYGSAMDTVNDNNSNASYDNAMNETTSSIDKGVQSVGSSITGNTSIYGMWSTIFLFFFMLLTYTSTIISVVNKSFELIHYIPDQIMRWVSGGRADNLGGSAVETMKGDLKNAVQGAANKTSQAGATMTSAIAAETQKNLEDVASFISGGLSDIKKKMEEAKSGDKKEDDSAEGGTDEDVEEEEEAGDSGDSEGDEDDGANDDNDDTDEIASASAGGGPGGSGGGFWAKFKSLLKKIMAMIMLLLSPVFFITYVIKKSIQFMGDRKGFMNDLRQGISERAGKGGIMGALATGLSRFLYLRDGKAFKDFKNWSAEKSGFNHAYRLGQKRLSKAYSDVGMKTEFTMGKSSLVSAGKGIVIAGILGASLAMQGANYVAESINEESEEEEAKKKEEEAKAEAEAEATKAREDEEKKTADDEKAKYTEEAVEEAKALAEDFKEEEDEEKKEEIEEALVAKLAKAKETLEQLADDNLKKAVLIEDYNELAAIVGQDAMSGIVAASIGGSDTASAMGGSDNKPKKAKKTKEETKAAQEAKQAQLEEKKSRKEKIEAINYKLTNDSLHRALANITNHNAKFRRAKLLDLDEEEVEERRQSEILADEHHDIKRQIEDGEGNIAELEAKLAELEKEYEAAYQKESIFSGSIAPEIAFGRSAKHRLEEDNLDKPATERERLDAIEQLEKELESLEKSGASADELTLQEKALNRMRNTSRKAFKNKKHKQGAVEWQEKNIDNAKHDLKALEKELETATDPDKIQALESAIKAQADELTKHEKILSGVRMASIEKAVISTKRLDELYKAHGLADDPHLVTRMFTRAAANIGIKGLAMAGYDYDAGKIETHNDEAKEVGLTDKEKAADEKVAKFFDFSTFRMGDVWNRLGKNTGMHDFTDTFHRPESFADAASQGAKGLYRGLAIPFKTLYAAADYVTPTDIKNIFTDFKHDFNTVEEGDSIAAAANWFRNIGKSPEEQTAHDGQAGVLRKSYRVLKMVTGYSAVMYAIGERRHSVVQRNAERAERNKERREDRQEVIAALSRKFIGKSSITEKVTGSKKSLIEQAQLYADGKKLHEEKMKKAREERKKKEEAKKRGL